MTFHPSRRCVLMAAAIPVAVAVLDQPGAVLLGAEAPASPGARYVEILPGSRGGQDVVGTSLPSLEFDRWLPDAPPADAKGGHPPVELYRWWTVGCPFCEKTLPAVEQLRQKYEKQGLRTVAVFHPKPVAAVVDEQITGAAKRMGYGGRIAVDEDWSELKRAYLDRSKTTNATSVSLLVDRKGIVRFVHPGTQYFPSDEAGDAREDADFKLLVKAIEALIAEKV